MYKLMIIDDEAIVREGIKLLFSWEDEGFELCAEAANGREGLEKMLSYQPELVLVDIKMPGINGIELIKRARAEGFQGQFIILTGYSEFDFAKSAISLGVKDYILKPINEKKLLENVRKICKELEQKKEKKAYDAESQLKAKEEVLRRILLHSSDRNVLAKEIERFQIDLNCSTYCVAIVSSIELLENEQSINQEKFNLLVKGIKSVRHVLMGENKMVLIQMGYPYIQFEEELLARNERVKKIYGSGFFISVGHNVSNWFDINFSYECANYLLGNKFLYKDRGVISIDIIQGHKEAGRYIVPEHLSTLIEVGDVQALKEEVDKFKCFCRFSLMKEPEIKLHIIINIITIQNILEKQNEQLAKLENEKHAIEDVNNANDFMELLDIFYQYLMKMCNDLGESNPKTIIRRVYAYMEKNYYKSLKLEAIAKIFNYNNAYLGKLFRLESGDSFNNILDQIRIDNAKRLLMETDLKVYQVAMKVGYSNVDYFHIKFKKYAGVSPKEFKKNKVLPRYVGIGDDYE